MKIKKIEYINGMQREAVISLDRHELVTLCNGLYLLSEQKDSKYDKDLHTQMRVARDIIDYGAVDDFTFNMAVGENE